MKICFINYSHLDATIPLAKRLAKNNDVSMFCIFSDYLRNMDAIDLTGKEIKEGVISYDKCNNYLDKELLEYIGDKFSINIVFFKTLNIRNSFYQTLIKLRKVIDEFNPDIINIVGHSYFLKLFHLALWSFPRVHTTHEVIAHNKFKDFSESTSLLDFLVDKNQFFIFPSKVTFNRFHDSFKLEASNTMQIYFGKHELYGLFNDQEILSDDRTALFFGKIEKYKGLEYLIEAAEICHSKIPNFKLIVAGNGDSEVINKLKQMPYVELINRSLSNSEVSYYLRRATIIVCPYISASSSGIPLSGYVFNKPVVASNVSGLVEVIEDTVNGLLVPPKNPKALADAIEKLLLDECLRKKMVNNIISDKTNHELNWDFIADKTLSFYNFMIGKINRKKYIGLMFYLDIMRLLWAFSLIKIKELPKRIKNKLIKTLNLKPNLANF